MTSSKFNGFIEVTVRKMLPDQFRRWFRMYPDTFEKLVHQLKDNPRLHRRENELSIPFWHKVYFAVFYLGNNLPTYT